MAMFLVHIALMLEAMGIAAGLVALYYARQNDTKLIMAAGIVLLVFGISSALCTSSFAIKYSKKAQFDDAYGPKS